MGVVNTISGSFGPPSGHCVARVAEFGGARWKHPGSHRFQSTSEVNPDTVHKDRL